MNAPFLDLDRKRIWDYFLLYREKKKKDFIKRSIKKSTANSAQTAASNAATAASNAATAASNAQSTANTAQSTASTASTNASTALSTANSASSTASSALTKAEQALTKIANGEVSVIKSIQRGEVNGNATYNEQYKRYVVYITISAVNVSKSMVILDSINDTDGNSYQTLGATLISFDSSTQFTISKNSNYRTGVSWQVIEFA